MHTDACQVNQADVMLAHCNMVGHLLLLCLSKHHGKIPLLQEKHTTLLYCVKKANKKYNETLSAPLSFLFHLYLFLWALQWSKGAINFGNLLQKWHKGQYLIHKAKLLSFSIHKGAADFSLSSIECLHLQCFITFNKRVLPTLHCTSWLLWAPAERVKTGR